MKAITAMAQVLMNVFADDNTAFMCFVECSTLFRYLFKQLYYNILLLIGRKLFILYEYEMKHGNLFQIFISILKQILFFQTIKY